ncbi:MAG: hypothetical protein AABX29_01335 [Nanoarchaeota archaeon]
MALKDKLVMGACAVGLVAALFLSQGTNNSRETQEIEKAKSLAQQEAKDKAYVTFKEEADANHDGHLAESELIKVYEMLGLKYDARKPDNLSEEQMKKYLDLKKQSYLSY